MEAICATCRSGVKNFGIIRCQRVWLKGKPLRKEADEWCNMWERDPCEPNPAISVTARWESSL